MVDQDLPRRLEAVHHRHCDVHQHDVRADRPGELHRLAPVARVARDLDPVVGRENGFERLREQPVVIGDQNTNRFWEFRGSL